MIVITGASKGLGAAIAERCRNNGHSVFGLARDTSNLSFPGINCDVGDYQSLKDAVRAIKKAGEPLTAVINAAGIAAMNMAVTSDEQTVRRIIQTNLTGTIFACQLLAPLMMRRKAGTIITFSTIAVPLAMKGESIYAASKAGVEAFTRTFAREVADFGIRVNCISPGPIKTDLLRGVSEAQIDAIVSHQLVPQRFTKDDVCDLVDLLLDDKARSLSGQVLHVGGV
ncbi:SDR family NAD(P)-dependent oxidoreductase [Pseudohoeflea coraliihabitans]|uniref:SDR family oxidoreductase n=1 Tax=Pseudohoeflea coraliihabitans TaxID=2860393 RepID=A0ABS6WKM0_9HYPH|nr:SDR family oxidoreductase [Pseudohoeflea sp. DP4N28-3]MBW3096484.1 SDR family oxidoreductase [Pseudohoeflea sp. DP4N28-3]